MLFIIFRSLFLHYATFNTFLEYLLNIKLWIWVINDKIWHVSHTNIYTKKFTFIKIITYLSKSYLPSITCDSLKKNSKTRFIYFLKSSGFSAKELFRKYPTNINLSMLYWLQMESSSYFAWSLSSDSLYSLNMFRISLRTPAAGFKS